MSANIKAPPLGSAYVPATYGGTLRSARDVVDIPSAADAAASTKPAADAADAGAAPMAEAARRAQEAMKQERDAPSDVTKAMEEANKRLAMDNIGVRFRIFEDRVQIQIVDSKRERVVRSVPSDEMLRLSSRMRELSGIGALVDRSL